MGRKRPIDPRRNALVEKADAAADRADRAEVRLLRAFHRWEKLRAAARRAAKRLLCYDNTKDGAELDGGGAK